MPKFTKLANIVPSQLPKHIQEDYPTFTSFLKAYYEYLDNQKLTRSLEYLRDPDQTLDAFIGHLKNEVAVLAPQLSKDRFFLKHTKESYVARGSEEAYKCLFRFLYNKEVEINYPSEKIFKISGGQWEQDVSFFLKVDAGDAYSLQNDYLYINDIKTIGTKNHTHRVYVKKVRPVTSVEGVYEVFIEKNFYGNLDIGDTVDYKGVVGTLLPTPAKVKITTKGSGFKVGQIFSVDTSIASGCKVKVVRIDANGGLEQVQIIAFGYGYKKDFDYNISRFQALQSSQAVRGLTIQRQDVLSNSKDSGYINKVSYHGEGYSSGDYVGDVLADFYYNNYAEEIEQIVATLRIQLGALARYPGYYASSNSLISDDSFIQDGEYYQDFSYVLRIDEKLTSYRDAVLQTLHPVGRKLFGDYLVETEYSLTYEISNPVIRILIPQFSESIEAVEMTEYGVFAMVKPLESLMDPMTDLINTKDVTKEFSPSFNNGDSFDTSFIRTNLTLKSLPTLEVIGDELATAEQKDTFTMNDTGTVEGAGAETSLVIRNISKPLTDSQSISESHIVDYSKTFSKVYDSFGLLVYDTTEYVVSADTAIKGIEKPLDDSISEPTDSSVYLFGKALSDSTDEATESTSYAMAKSLSDVLDSSLFGETVTSIIAKPLTETFLATDVAPLTFNKYLTDSVSLDDTSFVAQLIRNLSDEVLTDDSTLSYAMGSPKTDTTTVSDVPAYGISKSFADTTINNDSGYVQLNPFSSDVSYFAEAYRDSRTTF